MEELAIVKDIETASLEELQLWAEEVGISVSDNVKPLKKALAKYYNVTLSETSKESSGKVITIEKAELSKYYTLEELDESYAEFSGRVEIIIDDTEREIQHSVTADKVIFNRSLNSFTAIGDVEYIKTEKGSPESINAESLTFDLTSWTGSILKCISKQDKTINEEEMVFYYVSGEIKRSDSNVTGMNNVTIQTVEGSPYFNISAYDLWMLDSSDFVIVAPTIKVGHVPLFFAPFYYHSDNNLYFNPSYGIQSRKGTIFQNTIYFMGNKPVSDDESDFSFLSFSNEEASNNKEINGLTLVPTDDKTKYSDDYSKLMVDYYSNLGMFIGNTTELSDDKSKTTFTINGGLGFSRNIDDSDGTIFTDSESVWNSSYIFDTEVPFRYMMELTLDSSIVDLDFKTYSDSYFRSDFYDREENFKWVDYFTSQFDDGIETLSSSSDEDYSRDSTEDEISSYEVTADFTKISPELDMVEPYIDNFYFDMKTITLDYSSKVSQEYDSDGDLEDSYEDYDPSYEFFYPETLTIPMTMSISGDIFNTKKSSSNSKNNEDKLKIYSSENPVLELESPVSSSEEDPEVDKKESSDNFFTIESDDLFGDLKENSSNNSSSSTSLFWSSLSYNIKTPLNIYGYYDYDEWYSPIDVDYSLDSDELLYNFDPSGDLTFKANILNSFITLEDTLDGNIYMKSYFEDSDQDDLESVYSWNKKILDNDLDIKMDIFKLFPDEEKNSLKFEYELDILLYKESFDDDSYEENGSDEPYYLTETFEWDEDYVYTNEISGTYTYELDFSTTKLNYTKVLPPFDNEDDITLSQVFGFDITENFSNNSKSSIGYNNSVDSDDSTTEIEIWSASQDYTISFYDLSLSVNTGFEYSDYFLTDDDYDDEWEFSPLEFELDYKVEDLITFGFDIEYDIEEEVWDTYTGSLSIWDFDLKLASSYDYPVSWDSDDRSWEEDTSADKVLLPDYFTIEHNLDLANFYSWKNRIKLNVESELSFTKEFIEVDDSLFKYDLNFNMEIHEFLDLSLTTSSKNSTIYQYFENDSSELGLTSEKNFFEDLIKSFNFFNDEDRSESGFNLYSIELDATYKMPDWNLIFSYEGYPKLDDYEYDWYQEFSFFIEWKPLALVRTNIEKEDDDWTVSTSSDSD